MKHLVKVETYKFSNGSIYIKILKKENKQKKKKDILPQRAHGCLTIVQLLLASSVPLCSWHASAEGHFLERAFGVCCNVYVVN